MVGSMPRIREVRLRNFKSFGQKTTVIKLDSGFTALTGPNGSGKSNIIDAILFGLGELSAKKLRAERLTKLVRNGARKAEVIIQFDNSDRSIPIDSKIITISREIDRNGESVFRLNGRRIQRFELLNLLSVAGIGPSGSNIVAQGTITHLTTISPNERRKILEDIIGISQYDAQKAEAEEKLRRADAALKDALGRSEEIRRRLWELERERNDLLRYRLIDKEYRSLKALEISIVMDELRSTMRVLTEKLRAEEEKLEQFLQRRRELEQQIQRLEEEREKIRMEAMKGGGDRLPEVKMQIGRLESKLNNLNYIVRNSLKRIEELNEERERKARRLKTLIADLNQKKAELEKLKSERDELEEKLQEAESRAESLNSALRELIDRQSISVEEALKLGRRIKELYSGLVSAQLGLMYARASKLYTRRWMGDHQWHVQILTQLSGMLREAFREQKAQPQVPERLLLSLRIAKNALGESQLRLEILRERLSRLAEVERSAQARVQPLLEELGREQRRLSEMQEALNPQRLHNLQEQARKANEELRTLQARLNQVKAREESLKLQLENVLEPEIQALKREIPRIDQKILEFREEMEKALSEKAEAEERLRELREAAEELSSKLSGAQELEKSLTAQIEEVRSRLRELDGEYEEQRRLIEEIRITLGDIQGALNRQLANLRSLGYEDPIEIPEKPLKNLHSKLEALKKEREKLENNVNQLALKRYEEEVSRYKRISSKLNELERDRDAILKFIEEIEQRKRKAFLEAFNKLNKRFSQLFTKLTGEGKARLELENPSDPFSGGMDILVQFPGKPEMPVSGASGGERSVTAVAFLLALQQFTPSSFYIFDEIDAHLDPYYVDKLGELLSEESKKSQFIVISLKPELVRKAGKIYGLYFQRGCSHVVPLPKEAESVD